MKPEKIAMAEFMVVVFIIIIGFIIIRVLYGEGEEKVGVCPMCGGETRIAHYEADQTSAQCETYVEMCLDCDWQGEPG